MGYVGEWAAASGDSHPSALDTGWKGPGSVHDLHTEVHYASWANAWQMHSGICRCIGAGPMSAANGGRYNDDANVHSKQTVLAGGHTLGGRWRTAVPGGSTAGQQHLPSGGRLVASTLPHLQSPQNCCSAESDTALSQRQASSMLALYQGTTIAG